MKWWFQRKKPESQKEQQVENQPATATTPELPYVGSNLDALQKRVAVALRALTLVGDSATPVSDYMRIRNNLDRLQDEAERQNSKVTRLVGSREMAIVSGTPLLGTPYPLMGILSGSMRGKDACMLWVPGHEQFYRVVAYHGHGFEGGRTFDGNTFIFDEKLLAGADLSCCMVDEWGRAGLLPHDHLTTFASSLRDEVHPAYKVPLVIGNPGDSDSWKWAAQAQRQEVIILGNMV